MKKLKFGNIFEVSVLSKLAYFQYLDEHEMYASLLRVFATMHDSRPAGFDEMLTGPSFRLYYPLKGAVKINLVRLVGYTALLPIDDPPGIPVPRSFASALSSEDTIDIVPSPLKRASKEPETFVNPGTAGHAFLLHDILRANSIHIPVSDLCNEESGSDDARALFFALFPKKRDALAAARECDIRGLASEIRRADEGWQLILFGDPVDEIDEIDQRLEQIATAHNGTFDGHELALG